MVLAALLNWELHVSLLLSISGQQLSQVATGTTWHRMRHCPFRQESSAMLGAGVKVSLPLCSLFGTKQMFKNRQLEVSTTEKNTERSVDPQTRSII